MPFTLDPRSRPVHEEIIKKSRFIARVRRADREVDAADLIAQARDEERGAGHHCFAYIIGDELTGRVERYSDDGEPGGTAGAPILHVLKAKELVNVAAVVSRYFGGVKLGAGGLTRAYSGTVSSALEGVALHPRVRVEEVRFAVDHAQAGRVESELRGRGFEVSGVQYGEQATITVLSEAPSSLSSTLAEIASGRIELVHVGHLWR